MFEANHKKAELPEQRKGKQNSLSLTPKQTAVYAAFFFLSGANKQKKTSPQKGL